MFTPVAVAVPPLITDMKIVAGVPTCTFLLLGVIANTNNGVEVGATVTITVVVPFTLSLVAVIVLVPGAIAVNTPVLLLIVPTLVLLLDHVTVDEIALPSWSSVDAVKVVVFPTSTDVDDGEMVMFVRTGVVVTDNPVFSMTRPSE